MSKKDLLILSNKDESYSALFDVKKKNKTITLEHSKLSDGWSNPGSKSVTLKDTGNGLEFTSYTGDNAGQPVKLSYCDALELRALLKLNDNDNTTFELLKRGKK